MLLTRVTGISVYLAESDVLVYHEAPGSSLIYVKTPINNGRRALVN
jgi:hypothetical protein